MSFPVLPVTTRCQAITNFINAVNFEKAGLAHILNAEGEKIQKFISLNGTTHDQLLAINRSVKDLVTVITKLEIVLQFDLDLFEDCLCECEEDDEVAGV